MEGLPGASVFLYCSSTPFRDVFHINWVESETRLQIVKIWGWTSKQSICDFFPQAMQPSFDLITVSRKKQKERRTKTTLKARGLTFAHIAISLFIFLIVASVGSKRGGKQTHVLLSGAYQRLLSLNHLTRNMRRQNALLLLCVKRNWGDREGGSRSWPWDMSIPLKLF